MLPDFNSNHCKDFFNVATLSVVHCFHCANLIRDKKRLQYRMSSHCDWTRVGRHIDYVIGDCGSALLSYRDGVEKFSFSFVVVKMEKLYPPSYVY
ncbi:CLUMA_CG006845, isoform A [Clunio marinus]|uniref:CLUMA_CG006845, isoform A n=1 Tax=Clunio marinus TaxID=568069 RepID=A0A1J1I375_9DIPT|nr:CLUMA_CG006845, isoform A [Clunio marinus]